MKTSSRKHFQEFVRKHDNELVSQDTLLMNAHSSVRALYN